MINSIEFKASPDFGISGKKFGTLEVTKIQCQVNNILLPEFSDLNANPCILFLTYSQMLNLRHPYGSISIKNLITKQKITVEVKEALRPNNIQNSVDVSTEVAKILELENKSPIKIKRTINERGKLLLSCSDKEVNFGKRKHKYPGSYAAVGRISHIYDNLIDERHEIHLTTSQIAYLRINKHLTPLCGQEKYADLKKISPIVSGIVRLKYQDIIVEADVYQSDEMSDYGFLQGCAVKISRTLFDFFKKPPYCAEVLICSRFDIPCFEEAVNNSNYCVLNTQKWSKQFIFNSKFFPLSLKYFLESSKKNLFPKLTEYEKVDPFFSSHYLSYLSQYVDLIAQLPKAYKKVVNYSQLHCIEYRLFLDHLKEHRRHFEKHWEAYMEVFFRTMDPAFISVMLTDFMYMRFSNIQDKNGDTILHKFLNYLLAELRWDLIIQCKDDFNIQNNHGETPLHYLCKKQEGYKPSQAIFNICRKVINPLIADKEGKTPLHHACMVHNLWTIHTLLLTYSNQAINCLNAKDNNGKTPFDYFLDVKESDLLFLKEKSNLSKHKLRQAAEIANDLIIFELKRVSSKNDQNALLL